MQGHGCECATSVGRAGAAPSCAGRVSGDLLREGRARQAPGDVHAVFRAPGYRQGVTSLLDQLLRVPGPVVLLAGFVASTGRLSVVVLGVVVVLCAIIGDSVGYEVGKRFGPRMLRWRLFRRHEGRVDRARQFLDGRGGSAVFVGRSTAFLRAVTPGLAGLSGMRYRRFLLWNALGGVVW